MYLIHLWYRLFNLFTSFDFSLVNQCIPTAQVRFYFSERSRWDEQSGKDRLKSRNLMKATVGKDLAPNLCDGFLLFQQGKPTINRTMEQMRTACAVSSMAKSSGRSSTQSWSCVAVHLPSGGFKSDGKVLCPVSCCLWCQHRGADFLFRCRSNVVPVKQVLLLFSLFQAMMWGLTDSGTSTESGDLGPGMPLRKIETLCSTIRESKPTIDLQRLEAWILTKVN